MNQLFILCIHTYVVVFHYRNAGPIDELDEPENYQNFNAFQEPLLELA